MQENFDKKLLETKKKKFIEVVSKICKKRNLPIPSLNFDGCPAENEDQLAHYHPDVNMICISKRQLTVLNFDDLEEVAAHEIAHILEQNHDSNFRNEENTNKIFAWKPSGVVIIDGNQPVDDSTKQAMEKTEEGLKRLQEQIEREEEEEIRRKFPLAPPKSSDVIITKESPEDLEYPTMLQKEGRKKSYIEPKQIRNKLKERKVFSIRRERWKSDIKALGVGVGAGFVLMIAGSMFNMSSFIGLLGACIVAGVLSWKGRRIKNVVFAGLIMFMVMMFV
jgi:hypothetical protein